MLCEKRWKPCRSSCLYILIWVDYIENQSWWKIGGPPSKPKYSVLTESEQVPWGKGEKNPKKGVKRHWNPKPTNSWSFFHTFCVIKWQRTFCIMGQRVKFCGKLKPIGGGVGNPRIHHLMYSPKIWTRNRVISSWAGWKRGNTFWRTEPTSVAIGGDDLWRGVKSQTNSEIAGFLRNLCR